MLRIYLSHSIRGIKGNDATLEDMAENCRKAHEFAEQLRTAIADFEIYCPADHDEALSIAYHKGLLTIDELLGVDCAILQRRDAVLVCCLDNYVSGGMWVEIRYAQLHNIPVHIVSSLNHAVELVTRMLKERGR